MFTSQEVRERIRKQPFVPIRFVTSSGEHYDVHHPELVWVGRRDVHVGTASKEDPSVYEQAARLSLLHITAMEDLPVKGKRSNGAKR